MKHELPFFDEASEPRLDITVCEPLLRVVDAELGTRLRDASASSGTVRYGIALKIQKELRKVVSGIATEPPIYNVRVCRADDRLVAEMSYLPNFYCPSRIFRFSNWGKSDNVLYLSEVWHSHNTVLQPIDPSRFLAQYRIRSDDIIGFRAAVCEIVHTRLNSVGVARDSINRWFSPDSENIVPEYDDDA